MLLERDGSWYPGCGWNWHGSNTTTMRCMQSLWRRGLVEQMLVPRAVGWKVIDPAEAWTEVARAELSRTASPASSASDTSRRG